MTDDTYPNAGRDSGYVDDRGRSVGEDLINKVTAIVSAIQTKQTLDRQAVSDLTIEVKAANQRADAIYAWLAAEFRTNAEWRDQWSGEIQKISAATEATAQQVGKLAREVETLKQGQADNRAFQRQSAADRAQLNKKVTALSERFATLEREMGQVKTELSRLVERGDDG